MSTIEQDLRDAKQRVDAAKTERIRLEEQLKAQQAEEERVVEEMRNLGVSMDTISEEIERLDGIVTEGVAELRRLIDGAGEAVGA